MKILCIGGGPSGLYFGLLMKLRNPAHEVTVVERNKPYDTFGWGVVFSDATMENLREADPVSADRIYAAFNHWDDIDVHFKGRTITSSGHGFIGIGRKKLLNILQARCEEIGVRLVFETDVEDDQALMEQYEADLVIASDGVNSRIRTRYADTFQPDIDVRKCRYVWLGTRKLFDAFTFAFAETEHGWFQAHAYRFDGETSTFIVETPEEVWRAAGIEDMSQEEGIAFCERLFAPWLDGQPLISNARHLRGSASWIRFPRVICKTWVHWNEIASAAGTRRVPVVLMGDAAHTAHFSIGSGTKLALEDAIELTRRLEHFNRPSKEAALDGAKLEEALRQYDAIRSVEVLKIQNAARNSTEWFENVSRYAALDPEQFAYSLLTRSQRISHENLRVRDKTYVESLEDWLTAGAGMSSRPTAQSVPPMLTPYAVRGVTLANRVVVPPMLTYACEDGMPGDFHMVHLGARAIGGAGLVMMEMTAVSPSARVTPACPGLWNDAQAQALRSIVGFVHENSQARIGVQLGHAGPRGSTRREWEGFNQPLENDNWPLLGASALPYIEGVSHVPAAMTTEDMERVIADFTSAARRADAAGFDWLELQCGQGYLLSSFISPLTNRRADEFGGSLQNRVRFPLQVFEAIRKHWPQHKPISVRISATDWIDGGTTPDDAVDIARYFKEAGADLIVCSSGEVSPQEKPVYGRMYQTPFADRIRNEAGIATMAVGSIFEADHVNSIIASGRADLCAIGRPHLATPSWTLQETARLGYRAIEWPLPYQLGKQQLETNLARAAQFAQEQSHA
jgi:anthraniloyl-CoA monooxygenase